jgi:hypothetical protein
MPNYNWKSTFLDTFIPELPKLLNDNFRATQNYIGVFYDASRGIIISPINTPGNIRGARVEGVTGVFDNLIVRNQFTNLYENTTTIDKDYYNTFIGEDVSTRVADGSIWENTAFSYVDVNQSYYKIANDSSLAFKTDQLGQEFQLIFDPCTNGTADYTVMMDPCTNTGAYSILTVVVADASAAWVKLIATGWDASFGTTWSLKQFGGSFTIT